MKELSCRQIPDFHVFLFNKESSVHKFHNISLILPAEILPENVFKRGIERTLSFYTK